MPSKTGAQHRLMEMIAHGGEATQVKGGGPSVAVAKDFVAADKGKKFAKVKSMNQANSGGLAGKGHRAHTTRRPGSSSHGAYSMGPRGAKDGY
jgi:hypothetical protein